MSLTMRSISPKVNFAVLPILLEQKNFKKIRTIVKIQSFLQNAIDIKNHMGRISLLIYFILIFKRL